jgi:hypothetical protein
MISPTVGLNWWTNGGMFYDLSTFDEGYVDAVQVQPCSDAGGPDNCWWIERINVTIYEGWEPFQGVGATVAERKAHRVLHDMPDAERIENALRCCGWEENLADWDKLTRTQRRHVIVDACVSYGHYDPQDLNGPGSEMVSIGKPDVQPRHEREGKWVPDKVLRGNASLRRYAREKCETM